MTQYLKELENFPPWLVISISLLLGLLLLFLMRMLLLRYIVKITGLASASAPSILIAALKLPLTIVIFVLLVQLLQFQLEYFELAKESFNRVFNTASQILTTVAIVIFIERLATSSLSQFSPKSSLLQNSQSILKGFLRLFILSIGALILMGTFGISITPIIASLGITSLAVALALQPTLENFFSGVQLVVDRPIRIGDYIELESGEQGFVEKIGWRSTWIKMLPNNIVIMPNSVLSQSKIINYFYPSKELSVPVDVGVHYDSDLEEVERITLEVARDILVSHKWGVDEYETFVVFHTFDSSSINFTVMLRAKEYFNRFFIKSEFIKALHKRYAEEGIVIPYPIRALNTSQESAKINGNAVAEG